MHGKFSWKIATNCETISIQQKAGLMTRILGTRIGVGGSKERRERREGKGIEFEGVGEGEKLLAISCVRAPRMIVCKRYKVDNMWLNRPIRKCIICGTFLGLPIFEAS